MKKNSPRKKLILISSASFFIFLNCFAQTAPVNCPATVAEWNQWRDDLLLNINEPNDLLDGRAQALSECASHADEKLFFENKNFNASMAPLQSMLKTLQAVKSNELDSVSFSESLFPRNAVVSNDDFPEVDQIPDFFKSPAFLAATRNKKLNEGALARILQKVTTIYPAASIVRFNSRFGVSKRSILLLIPDKNVDRYLHMVWDDASDGFAALVFMVAVEKKTTDGKLLSPFRSFFTGYVYDLRLLSPEPHHQMLKKMLGSNKFSILHRRSIPTQIHFNPLTCYVCHRTGGMPIVPNAESPLLVSYVNGVPAETVIQQFNRQIKQTANARPSSLANLNLGPSLGPINPPTRTPEFIQHCAGDVSLSTQSIQKVQHAMNCQHCHDGERVGTLSFPLGSGIISDGFTPAGIFAGMIQSHHMPLHETLTDDEAKVTHQCLIEEYYGAQGLFRTALRAVACSL